MAGRPSYTPEEKARAYVQLKANGDNLKRTARELDIPVNTLRRWRDEWKSSGPPVDEEVSEAIDTFVNDAERVRNKALLMIEEKLPDAKVGELNAVVGTLTDKLSVIKGLATSRTEHRLALPSPEEMREALAPVLQQALALSAMRQEEIIDAEIVEAPRALPRHVE